MADGSITLPPPQTQLQEQGGLASNLGPAPPPRAPVTITPGDGETLPLLEVQTEDGTAVAFMDDGTIQIGAPSVITHRDEGEGFADNLALLPGIDLPGIAEEVIQGVEADILSRSDMIKQYEEGIALLGLKIEDLTQTKGTRRNISRANDTLLIESLVRYHSGAEAEMLPAEGPVKVQTIGVTEPEEEQRARDFQTDFNYYLTEIAREYYKDTSQMLMRQGFDGNGFKKCYRCPIRQRPVSESVNLLDLIVSEEATDLDNALRVTHQSRLTRTQVRRMQIAGRYREVDLGQPGGYEGLGGAGHRAVKEAEGIRAAGALRPQDMPYLVWESDTDLDIDLHLINGKFEREAPWGLPLPYKVTLDKESRQVLGIWRNWRPDDEFYRKRNMYTHFGMVPGMGFHAWGFLQLLGNQTKNLRSIMRILIDAGMFSLFPGGVKLGRVRANTNELSPGPGEFVDLDAPPGMNDIRQAIMPMPYKGPDAVFIQLATLLKQDARQLGGTVELETGQGRTNIPVGTILAQIEQQTQVMAGVFKRNHQAQREELHKLRELFAENPEDLWRLSRNPARKWEVKEEFIDLNLTPASDPNVPSNVHRLMLANVLAMLAQQMPQLFDTVEVARYVVRTIGADPDRFVRQPDQMQTPPDPRGQAAMAKVQVQQQEAQTEAATAAAKLQLEREKTAADTAMAAAENQTQRDVAEAKQQTEFAKAAAHWSKAAANQPAPEPEPIIP